MADYQTNFQNYSQTFDAPSAMQLAYYQSVHGGVALSDEPYTPQQWQQKATYPAQQCGQTQGLSISTNLLYISEFADPHSNAELEGHDLNVTYPAYSSTSGYSLTLEGTHPGASQQFDETVAGSSSYFPSEPICRSPPAFPLSSIQHDLNTPSDSFSVPWTDSSFQFSPASEAPAVRYPPYTVKSQRRTSLDVNGFDTPGSPLSLARSKRSSISPSPGPLTPAIGHLSLQAELSTAVGLDSRPPSQGSVNSLYTRNEEIDPDRPYPCGSCRMAFARQHDLTRHSRVHSGETPYSCHGCRQGFRRSDARSRHWGKDAGCLALHQRLVEGTEEGRKLQKSLSRLGDKAGRVGTATFRVHKAPTRSMRGSFA